MPFQVANPFDTEKRIDILVQDLPEGWKAEVDHAWVTLPARGRQTLNLTVTPKPDAPGCTSVALDVHGMVLVDDFIQPYAGFTPVIHLANPIKFQVATEPDRKERRTIVRGCTMPSVPNSEIALILRDPHGHDSVVFTSTDAQGCFQHSLLVPPNEPWTVRPYFRGNECHAPTEGDPVPLDRPTGGGSAPDGSSPPSPAKGCCAIVVALLVLILLILLRLWRLAACANRDRRS